eukprot:TRINITY_DN2376_c0_g1_i5.p1 TRINITY_DN2376_c0_g1~~TRINITY_DN2376_c0_g1_i5.p1  ORF type:complete len:614 (+),score=220.26 TRINITY_DN2376_c0_g1_i5:84-1925(+)
MFFSNVMLVKKGPLAKIWLAAHFHDKKLTKNHIAETNIAESVKNIVSPAVAFALRLSGQLLLGVCRIYLRKVQYLQQDCQDAVSKLKHTFAQRSAVDLPADHQMASAAAITRPENWDELELALPDLDLDLLPLEELPDQSEYRLMDEKEVEEVIAQIEEGAYIPPIEMVLLPQEEERVKKPRARRPRPDEEEEEEKEVGRGTDESIEIGRDASMMMEGPELELPAMDIDLEPILPPASEIKGRRDSSIGLDADLSVSLVAPSPARGDLSFGVDARLAEESPALAAIRIAEEVEEEEVKEGEEGEVRVRERRQRKRRKLQVNTVTELSREDIRNNLNDTSDICGPRPYIPLTKRARLLAERRAPGYAEVLMQSPSPLTMTTLAPELRSVFQRMFRVGNPDLPLPPEAEKPEKKQRVVEERKRARESLVPEPELPELPEAPELAEAPEMGEAPEMPEPQEFPEFPPVEFPEEVAEEKYAADLEGEGVAVPPAMAEDVSAEQVLSAEEEAAAAALSGTGWSNRTKKAYSFLQNQMADKSHVMYSELVPPPVEEAARAQAQRQRKAAAGMFYELLILKTRDFIQVKQEQAYGDIKISRAARFGAEPDSQDLAVQASA